MVRLTLIIGLVCHLVTPSLGQKVKYKDLFVLLNAKQYEQAEPFLRKYLAENDDNPNAHLFMGLIFQDKAAHNDVLKHTDILVGNLDSAVLFYDRAYKEIDEKEIKRNDEYYQAYNRRDLRTGKFGVKLSDVQFDLEKKMEALKERKELIRQLKTHYINAEALYNKAQFLYKDIQMRYGNFKTLYLQSNDTTVVDVKRVAMVFDSCLTAFNNYKAVSEKIGKTGYNQELTLREISDLGKDGASPSDFMNDKLDLWDYKKLASQIAANIRDEIVPMRDHLIAYDIEINKLREKLRRDSVSVRSDLTKLVDKILYDQLKKYDNDPLPMDVFGMKISELEYLSEVINHHAVRDSADLRLHLRLTQTELRELKTLDSLAGKLEKRDFAVEAHDYRHFITNAYGTPTVLKSLVRTTKDFAEREAKLKEEDLQKYTEALKWVVSETDTIPLSAEVDASSKYRPMITVEEKYTSGFQFQDTVATGYFRTITPSRKADIAVNFPVDNKNFTLRRLPVIKALSAAADNGQVYYVLFYSQEKVEDKFPATLAKIYRTDGLAWSSDLSCEMLPSEMTFQVETGEVSIKTSNPAGESKLVFIDRNGKRKDAAKP